MQVKKYFKYGVKVGHKMCFTRYTVEKTIFLLKVIIPYYARSIESTKPSVGARDLLK